MIARPQPRVPDAPLDAAAWWSARRRLGLMSPRDDRAFVRWLESPPNRAAWDATEEAIAQLGACASRPELRAMRDAALAARPEPKARPWAQIATGAIAASLVAGLIWVDGRTPRGPDGPAVAASAPRQYVTPVGQKRSITLADGSRVLLDTDSAVTVDYRGELRDVRLLRGQAFFAVAKDAARPFVVTAGDRRITAVGTAFNVKLARDGDVAVLLTEGRVSVDPLQLRGLARVIPAIAREELDPGERLSVERGEVQVAAFDVERGTSWQRGRLIFRDDRLSSAVDELNRYSTARIVIDDPRVADLRISGVFTPTANRNFLAAVTTFYPIATTQPAPGVILLRWRARDDAPDAKKVAPADEDIR